MKTKRFSILLLLLILFLTEAVGQSESGDLGGLETLETEKDALLEFKRGLMDPIGILDQWRRDTDPCRDQWPGIECSSTQRIQAINLPNFGLEGELPSVADLIALRSFRMPNNSLTGLLPEEWQELSLLETVDLTGNAISGPLPESWSDAPSLKNLYLNGNRIDSTLPPAWARSSFHSLALAGNRITGTLPANWGNMDHIEVLDLSHNRLTGLLPDSWSTLGSLRILQLNDNELFGSLPEMWSDMQSMEDLRLGNNNIIGFLPPEWSSMLNANTMLLNDNNLCGSIPEEWSALSHSCRIDLTNNPLVCSVPPRSSLLAKNDGPGLVIEGTNSGRCPSFSAMDTQALLQFKAEIVAETNGDVLEDWMWKGSLACVDGWTGVRCINDRVSELDLSHFGISGYLSEELSKMSSLEILKLEGNGFNGRLPETWGQIRTLKHLNLSDNSIGGVLPAEWGSLTELEVLDVSGNRLVGELPYHWSKLSNLRTLRGFNNSFDGPLPFAWSSMESLTHIQLQNNILTGSLPISWESFQRIETIDLSFNNLIGPVPSQWENLTSLSTFHLQGNEELCGGMPASLPSQPGLVQEVLSTPCPDYVTESILLSNIKNEVQDPSESLALWRAGAPPCLRPFESWPGITCEDGRVVDVDLTDFQLSGTLPDSLAQLSMLKGLSLGGNRFTGSLPLSWAELFRLEHLNVSFNALEGPLPPEWAVMVSLVTLDLSGNNFEGSLPSEWSRMVQLQSLNVSENVNLCGGLPRDFSKNVAVISVNSTFRNACSSNGDPSWAIPFISVLISVFVMVTLFIWISCFCCCCYQRKKQRGKLLEMMSNNLSKTREAQSKDIQPHASGSLDALTDNGPSASELTSQSAISTLSPKQKFPVNYEMPYAPRAVHPYYPIPGNRSVRSSVSHERASRGASSSRSPTPASRRSKSHIPAAVNEETVTQRKSTGFGSMQSVMGTTSHESTGKKTPRSPPAASLPRSKSALEMCRTLMEQPATPTECQPTVQRPRSSNQGRITPASDPRRRASKIPRGPTPSVTSSVKNGSSTHRSTDRSVHSERRGALSSPSPSSSYQVHFVPSETEVQSPPERFAPPVVHHPRRPDDRWQYPSAIPTASNRSTPSPTAEMFRWLESAYQSGTFDLEDVPRELLSKAAQQRQNGNSNGPTPVSSQRYPALNSATVASQGMQTSTKELLMWLESRIEEARESELNRARARTLQARDAWGQTDSNGLPLFNYKTCSTVEDNSD